MTNALLFLLAQSIKNRLLMRFRRLKQPKYLAGAIVGVAYFYLYFVRFMFQGHGRGGNPGFMNLIPAGMGELVGGLVLFVIVVLAWVIPHERAALTFTEAEVAFLFPAPVSRRTLIHFKLLKSQLSILFTVVFFTLVFRGARGGASIPHLFGWWVILSMVNLHLLGSSFARTLLLERGISNWKRRAIVLTIVAVLVAAVCAWVWQTMPPRPDAAQVDGFANIMRYVQSVLESDALLYLLLPFRLVVQPYLATDMMTFLRAMMPALVLLVAHYLWVVRSNVAFEEASVEASRKLSERVAQIRAGRGLQTAPKKARRAPFRLRPTGCPLVALLWKNLIGAGSSISVRHWMIVIWLAVVSLGFAGKTSHGLTVSLFVAPFLLMALALSIFLGPQLVRQDFRSDLPTADLLKTYPLRSWQLALGELLAPAVILTAIQWGLLLVLGVLSPNLEKMAGPPELRLSLAVAVAVLVPALNCVSLIIPNAMVLLFPGWFQTGRDAPQGVEAMGQRLILSLGQILVMAVAFLPAGLAFAGVFFVMHWLSTMALAIPVAAVAAEVVMAAEVAAGLLLLGHLFERLDISAESTPG